MTPPNFNLDEELRGDYLVPAELKQVWAVQLDLLGVLLDVCRRNNLRIWADGGTLLGLVRHHGFIPWDDDVDLCMPRPDYDRLVKLAPTAFKEPYFFQCAYTDTDYFRGHAQFRRSNTAAIRPTESYRKFNQGIFLDIFPLDGCPANEAERKSLVKRVHHVHKLLKAVNLNVFYSGRWLQIFRKWRCRIMVSRQGWDNVFGQTEQWLRQTPVDKAEVWAKLSSSSPNVLLSRHIFDQTLMLPFENIELPAPTGYDEFLRTQYGPNYMTPIKALPDHGHLVLSTTRSYREVAPEAYAQFKRDAVKRLRKKIINN